MCPLLETVHGGEVDAVFVQILLEVSLRKVQYTPTPRLLRT
jgi:hypothetical protein